MDRTEVPQATLERTREVVDAVARGCRSRDAIEAGTGISPRQVGYGLAAARALGLVAESSRDVLELTERGRALCASPAGSEEEAAELRDAIEQSPELAVVAGDLFAPEPPPREALAARIKSLAGLSDNTAAHRAGMILAWRRRLMGVPDLATRRAKQVGGRWRRLSLANYRGFDELTVELGPLSVLYGGNASGKSSLADALVLLGELAKDAPAAIARRGGFEALVRDPALPLLIDVRAGGTREALDHSYVRHRVELSGPELRFERELCELVHEGVRVAGLDRQGDTVGAADGERALEPHLSVAHLAPGVRGLRTVALDHVLSLRLDPTALRARSSAGAEARMESDGSRLGTALARLRGSRSFPGLLEAMRDVVPGLHDLATDAEGGVTFERAVTPEQSLVLGAWSMSDGALLALGILVAALQLGSDELLVVEHPERQLDPRSLAVVVEGLKAASRRAGVVVTTHSQALVEAVDSASVLTCSYRAGRTAITEHE